MTTKIPKKYVVMGDQEKFLGLNEEFLRKMKFLTNEGRRVTFHVLFYSAVVITASVGGSYSLYKSRQNLAIFAELFDTLVALIETFFKACCLVYHRDRFLHYIFVVRSNFFQTEQMDITYHRHILQECEKKCRVLFITFIVSCIMTGGGFLIYPLVRLSLLQDNFSNSTVEQGEDWYLPFYVFFPIEFSTRSMYILVYLFQTYYGVMTIALVPGLDNFVITLLSHVCSQFKILNDNLENLQQYAMEHVQKDTHSYNNWYSEFKRQNYKLKEEMIEQLDGEGIDLTAHLSKHWKPSGDNISIHLHMEMRRRIKMCVEHHQLLIKFVKDFESIFNPILLIQFISSTCMFCMTAFSLVMLPLEKLFIFISMVGTTSLQLFMYCFVGQLMKDQGEAVGFSAYSSQWYDFPEDIKSSLLIIMACSRRPVILTLCKFAPLTMGTFAATVQGSYTYFTLLNDLNG